MNLPSCHISIHDVCPNTLPKVINIVDILKNWGIFHVTLLIIPKKPWQAHEINQLKRWQQAGYVLAGHGNTHHCKTISTASHKLHSMLISRDVAEHLSQPNDQIIEMIQYCYHWFLQNQLNPPELYVPPAWAMGALTPNDLKALPFRYYETLAGIYDNVSDQFSWMPLLGFEADTHFRKVMVRLSNKLNELLARYFKKDIRLAIHPDDFDLLLGNDLAKSLKIWGVSSLTKYCRDARLCVSGRKKVWQFLSL